MCRETIALLPVHYDETLSPCRRTGETGAVAERMQGGMQDILDTIQE